MKESTLSGPSNPIAQMVDARRSFGDTDALDGLSLSIPRGETVAILGPNGAGKTTAIRVLLGLIRLHHGQAEVFGQPAHTRRSIHRIGTMLQTSGLPETLKVREVVDMFRRYYPRPLSLTTVLERMDLDSVADQRVGRLSGGQMQRVTFACAICGDPDLLFLDEPTVGLDIRARHKLWEFINEQKQTGKTVVLTTHYLEEADQLADRIHIMNAGSLIASGTPTEIRSTIATDTIRFRTDASTSRVKSLIGDTEGQILADGRWQIVSNDTLVILRNLLTLDDLCELETTRASLDEAFLALTRDGQPTDNKREAA